MGKRAWLDELIADFIRKAENADAATLKKLSSTMRQAWSTHGLSTLPQQRNLMTAVRSAIKRQLGADHLALEIMNFTQAEWIEMNHKIAEQAAKQNEKQVILTPATVNAIVYRATNLLQSREWAEVAAGLVVLTGRRSSEVLRTASFEYCSDCSVLFTGALKRRGEATELTFEIHTLCQAQYVIDAVTRLRSRFPEIQSMTNAEVNASLTQPVALACEKHFSDIVSTVAGKGNLYTHLFRKVNAAITTYFFCPPTVDDAEFRAEHQGHFSGHSELNGRGRRVIASDRHYRSYIVADADGAIRKGVKLGQHGVKPLDVFTTKEEEPVMKTTSKTPQKSSLKRPALYSDDLDKMTALMASHGITGTHAQVFSAFVDAFQQGHKSEADQTRKTLRSVEWFTSEIDKLRERVSALESERDALQVKAAEPDIVEALRADNEKLQAELSRANAMLDYFRRPFETPAAAIPTPSLTPVVAATTVKPPAPSAPVEDGKGELDPDIVRAVEAIMHYNDSVAENTSQKWAISYPALKELLKTVNKSSQPKIQAVLRAKEHEIADHHARHLLGERHNKVHSNQTITDYISIVSR